MNTSNQATKIAEKEAGHHAPMSQPTLLATMDTAPPSQPRRSLKNKRYAHCFDDSTEWEQDLANSLDKVQQQIKELDDRALARRLSEDMCFTPRTEQRDSARMQIDHQTLPSPPLSPTESMDVTARPAQNGGNSLSSSTTGAGSSSREDLSDLIRQFPRPPPLLSIPRHSALSLSQVLSSPAASGHRGSNIPGYQNIQSGLPTPPLTPLTSPTHHDAQQRRSMDFTELGWHPIVRREDFTGGARTCKRRPLGENAGRVKQAMRTGRVVTEGKENATTRRT
ncbi:hypothetical protein OE88DRAFT_1740269 [Heliocybe sulcata]|uniref:Uncharacterized protein n=1 Tax=Heliocybe sulcata TaxID=5364 RepID=A0A5C3MVK8_9AGAM|nr:hypothetical protein OE88DRAFT_1740269 [Heliocybe sulcata]